MEVVPVKRADLLQPFFVGRPRRLAQLYLDRRGHEDAINGRVKRRGLQDSGMRLCPVAVYAALVLAAYVDRADLFAGRARQV